MIINLINPGVTQENASFYAFVMNCISRDLSFADMISLKSEISLDFEISHDMYNALIMVFGTSMDFDLEMNSPNPNLIESISDQDNLFAKRVT